MDVIGKGAEAYIYRNGSLAIKVRCRKEYRHNQIDERLKRTRTKREATAIKKCNENGITCPQLISFGDNEIHMEYVSGRRMSELFENLDTDSKVKYALEVGRLLAKMHKIHLCHGDYALTNFIVSDTGKVYVIDFGLSEFSTYYEKKAGDISVMWSSMKDDHLFNVFKEEYIRNYEDANKVIDRFEKNRLRGRYIER
ncbi:MAG: KEOPS complex kinase/ATPase Bud32 [Candidatus Micrarchaeia archaeon]